MKKNYFLFLFSLYTIVSFGQFDVSEMEYLNSNSNSSYTFSNYTNNYKLVFNNDGTKVFTLAVNTSNERTLNQFSLDTPYNISSISEPNATEYKPDVYVLSFAFNNDGTELFIFDPSEYKIKKYYLTTAFDLTNVSFAGDFESFNSTGGPFHDFRFNNDGTKLYTIYDNSISEYSLITPFDVSSANYSEDNERLNFNTNGSGSYFSFNKTGTKVITYNSIDNYVAEYNLSTAFDISTGSYNQKFNLENTNNYTNDIKFSNDGLKMFIVDYTDETLVLYGLSTPFDISTIAIPSDRYNPYEFNLSTEESAPLGLTFNTDGTKLFTVGSDGDAVVEYSLSTAFNLSTASYSGASEEFLVNSQEPTPQDVQFNNTGTKMFVVGSSADAVIEYNLTIPFDVSTSSYAGDAEKFSVKTQEAFPTGMSFDTNGTKMFVVGHQAQAVLEYSLNTAYDVSTASYNGDTEKFLISSQETTPEGILFNTDGSKMFILGSTSDAILEYNLTTPFDVSTASFTGDSEKLDVSGQDNTPTAFAFDTAGNKLFLVGTENGTVYTYSNGEKEETLSFESPNNNTDTTIYFENGQFKNNTNGKISVFNIVGQQIKNNNLNSGIYIIILKSEDGSIHSFKKAI